MILYLCGISVHVQEEAWTEKFGWSRKIGGVGGFGCGRRIPPARGVPNRAKCTNCTHAPADSVGFASFEFLNGDFYWLASYDEIDGQIMVNLRNSNLRNRAFHM